jgi:hypothetical protein
LAEDGEECPLAPADPSKLAILGLLRDGLKFNFKLSGTSGGSCSNAQSVGSDNFLYLNFKNIPQNVIFESPTEVKKDSQDDSSGWKMYMYILCAGLKVSNV